MILVTGGTGLVGSHLLFKLTATNSTVRAIYRSKSKLENVKKVFSYYTDTPELLYNKIEWIQADILDIPSMEIAFKDVAFVYHAAALISFDPSDFNLLKKVNVEGTANIVNLCIANAIKKLCYVSSIAAIGKSALGAEVNEENEWTPQHANVYALTKYEAEIEVWRGSQENLAVIIVNPGVILGPGYWKNGSGKFFATASKGYSYFPPGGSGFVTVFDVVTSMLQLMNSTTINQRFILVNENLSFKNILSRIANRLGIKPPKRELKKWQLQIGRYFDYLTTLIIGSKRKLTKNAIYSLLNPQFYSNKKLKKVLNFEFESIETVVEFSCEKFIEEYS